MRRRLLVALTYCLCSWMSAACGKVHYDEGGNLLVVQVVTDLVPGVEFDLVETTAIDDDARGTERVLDSTESRVRLGSDFANGHEVGRFRLGTGTHLVRVRLKNRGGSNFVVEQRARLSLQSSFVLRVHITRDCVGVMCGVGSAADLSACLNGQCVDPRCDATHPEFCGSLQFCNDGSSCPAVAACATAECDDGICVAKPLPNSCSDTEWCNPVATSGCTPLERTPTGPVCGTICNTSQSTCRASYWNCDGPAPICQPLFTLPAGTECAAASVCDLVGSCVACNAGVGCSVGCARGEISCATGAPVCVLAIPSLYQPEDSACLDVGTCTDGETCVTNGTCDASGVCFPGGAPVAGVIVTPSTGLTTTEGGGTAMVSFRLAKMPESEVTISLATSDASEGIVAPLTLIFTSVNWNVVQSITLTGINDLVADGNQTYFLHSTVTSSDADYNGLPVPDVDLLNIDDETPGITLAPSSGLTTTEAGGTATFTIQLNTEPVADVSVSFTSMNALEGSVVPLGVTFTTLDWNVPQTVVVTGVDDFVADGDVAYVITSSPAVSTDPAYAGIDPSDVSVTNQDDDMPGILVMPTAGLTTAESGATDTFSIVLTSEPVSDVTIPLSSSNVGEGNSTVASLTFTPANWNVPQVVTVQGANDAVEDGNAMYSVVTGAAVSTDPVYGGRASNDVTVTNLDDDTAGISVTPTVGLLTSEVGGTATFDVTLDSEPIADVSVAVTSSNSGEGTALPASLLFTAANWNVPQTVTVTGVNDHVFDPDVAFTVINQPATSADPKYAGVDPSDVALVNRTALTQQGYFKASNTGMNDRFFTVALSADGSTMAIGANGEASSAPGVGADQTDNTMANAGAVYIFTLSSGIWSQQAYIKASNPGVGDYFGAYLGLSADGSTLAAASWYEDSAATGIDGNQADNTGSDSGAVYVFTRSAGTWSQQAYLKASNTGIQDSFGISISLSADGNTLAVGAQWEDSGAAGVGADQSLNTLTNAGAAYVFTRAGIVWTQEAYIKSSNPDNLDVFGHNVALSADGNTLAVGAFFESSNATGINGDQSNNANVGAGAVYMFTRSVGVWSQQAYIKASNSAAADRFGIYVAISGDGDTVAVGAYLEDSNATGINGDQSNNAAADSGAVYVFTRSAGVWTQQAYIKASNTDAGDQFGFTVALDADGDTLLVGAYHEGSNAVGLFGDQLNNAATNSGAVYAFSRTGGVWTQQAYMKASNTNASDLAGGIGGIAISADGRTVAFGAAGEASNATGIGGDQSNNLTPGSGAVYVYTDA